ncbi:MAG: hypothetical protein ACLVJH_09515 [Faecalibacterium prausnitzii]
MPLQTAGSSRPSAPPPQQTLRPLQTVQTVHGKVALNACTVKEDGTIFPF